jgi:protein-tyrosine-phosphatase
MRFLVFIGLFVSYLPFASAQVINLECGKMADEMVKRMDREGVLVPFQDSNERASDIVLEMCEAQQENALQQHEKDKQHFIKNWLTENTGGKPGNDRLRKFKH